MTAQTQIPATTTILQLRTLAAGSYYFLAGTDTVKYTACTPMIIKCTVDTAAILALKICPITPICPPPKLRTAIGITELTTSLKKTVIITYDDGSSTTL